MTGSQSPFVLAALVASVTLACGTAPNGPAGPVDAGAADTPTIADAGIVRQAPRRPDGTSTDLKVAF